MSQWEDFLLAIMVQIIGFNVACWFSWKLGKPMTKKGQLFARVFPYIFLLYSVFFAADVLWPEAKYSHPWLLTRRTVDAVLMLIAWGLAAIYARIAPAICAAGAKHHPAPVIQRSAAQIHLQRRVRKAVMKQSIPLWVLGIGVSMIAIICGYSAKNGEWIMLGFLGIGAWQVIIVLLVDRQIRKQVKFAEKA